MSFENPRSRSRASSLVLACTAILAVPVPALASVSRFAGNGATILTRDEALALAFPGCEIERQTEYLSDEQRAEITEQAGVEFEPGIVYPYRATKEGALVGTAYFDVHRVRSLRETLMVVVAPDSTIRRVEVLAFLEPKDYLLRDVWYGQFEGQALSPDLQLNRAIRNVTGATLSGRAATSCVRRVLALHRTLCRIAAAAAGSPAHEKPPRIETAESRDRDRGGGGAGKTP